MMQNNELLNGTNINKLIVCITFEKCLKEFFPVFKKLFRAKTECGLLTKLDPHSVGAKIKTPRHIDLWEFNESPCLLNSKYRNMKSDFFRKVKEFK